MKIIIIHCSLDHMVFWTPAHVHESICWILKKKRDIILHLYIHFWWQRKVTLSKFPKTLWSKISHTSIPTVLSYRNSTIHRPHLWSPVRPIYHLTYTFFVPILLYPFFPHAPTWVVKMYVRRLVEYKSEARVSFKVKISPIFSKLLVAKISPEPQVFQTYSKSKVLNIYWRFLHDGLVFIWLKQLPLPISNKMKETNEGYLPKLRIQEERKEPK